MGGGGGKGLRVWIKSVLTVVECMLRVGGWGWYVDVM